MQDVKGKKMFEELRVHFYNVFMSESILDHWGRYGRDFIRDER